MVANVLKNHALRLVRVTGHEPNKESDIERSNIEERSEAAKENSRVGTGFLARCDGR